MSRHHYQSDRDDRFASRAARPSYNGAGPSSQVSGPSYAPTASRPNGYATAYAHAPPQDRYGEHAGPSQLPHFQQHSAYHQRPPLPVAASLPLHQSSSFSYPPRSGYPPPHPPAEAYERHYDYERPPPPAAPPQPAPHQSQGHTTYPVVGQRHNYTRPLPALASPPRDSRNDYRRSAPAGDDFPPPPSGALRNEPYERKSASCVSLTTCLPSPYFSGLMVHSDVRVLPFCRTSDMQRARLCSVSKPVRSTNHIARRP